MRVATLAGLVVAGLATTLAPCLTAQQPGKGPVQVTDQGILVDFQDADLRLVVSALAEAGGLNVVFGDLPARRITLQMRQPVQRDAILPLLRNLAQSNGLRVTEDGTFLRIEGDTSPYAAGPTGTAAGSPGGQDQRLFVYRLKHARATKLAGTLQALYGGRNPTPGAGGGIRETSLSQGLRSQQVPPIGDSTAATAVQGPGLPGRLQGDVEIVADEATNALLVRAIPQDWNVIQAAIDRLDLRPAQVLIEVTIAEVQRTSELDLSVSGTAANDATNPTAQGTLTGETNGSLVLQLLRAGTDQQLALSALAQRGNVRILSRPVILAQNNLESKILVGSQRPFIQVSRTLPTDQAVQDQIIQYRDVGTKLTLLPTVNEDGYVNLEVLQEVSNATNETQFGAPVISTREASTHLFVKSGQTGVIGGLVSRETDNTKTGIPLLMDIPVLGHLFGTTHHTVTNSELFIFLTPYIINTDQDLDRAREQIQNRGEMLKEVLPDTIPLLQPSGDSASPAKPW